MLRAALWAALLVLGQLLAGGAAARPFVVEDLLHQSSLGGHVVDPSGRWFVYELRGPYDQIGRYDLAYGPSRAAGRLQLVDLRRAKPPRPLVQGDPTGLTLGPFSPSGDRLAVFRLRERRWELGIVRVATGAVRWYRAAPRGGGAGRSVQWLSDNALLVLSRTDGHPPFIYRTGWLLSERLPKAWDEVARGGTASTLYGSGAYAGVRPRAAPTELLRIDVEKGEVRQLARGDFNDLDISPDKSRVALFEQGADRQPRPEGPVRGAAGFETEETHLVVVNLRGGAPRALCPGCDLSPQLLDWSPDGAALLVFRRGASGDWTDGRLLRIDAEAGGVTPLGAGLRPVLDSNPVVVRAAWMGARVLLLARPQEGGREDWYLVGGDGASVNLTGAAPEPGGTLLGVSAAGVTVASGDRVRWIDPAGRVVHTSEEGIAAAPGVGRTSEGARLALRPGANAWAMLGPRPGRDLALATPLGLVVQMALPPTVGEVVDASSTARVAVVRRTDARGVTSLWRVDAAGSASPIAEINTYLAQTDAPRVFPVRHAGDQGQSLTSWLFLPARATPGRPPPLIVRPYLGSNYPRPPGDLPMEEGFLGNLRMLVGHGYAVLVPSLPTPPQGLVEPMDRLADRILAIERAARLDPALAGCFDPTREALLGWSFGGYTTMAAVTQTDHFQAAVAVDGISDLTAYWAHLPLARQLGVEDGYISNWTTGAVESTQPTLGAPPWRERDRYVRNSPLWFADRISTPLLLIHGWRDPVPVAGSEAMYSALFRQGKDAMLAVYWGADHHPDSPGDVASVWALTFRFLDERLDPARAGRPPRASVDTCRARDG